MTTKERRPAGRTSSGTDAGGTAEQPADRRDHRSNAQRVGPGYGSPSNSPDSDDQYGFRAGRPLPAGHHCRSGFWLLHCRPSHSLYCRIPENFRITAVKVYEIRNGQLGRLYRDGGITADSRNYFQSIDAVGNDLRVNPIPNCGKGQPMQAKRMSNGGPTMRGVARLTGPG